MIGAFDSSLSGMRSTQTLLDVTANNLANATTYAFKASRTQFADERYFTVQAGQGAGSTTGGINPTQVGNGVSVSAIDPYMGQGPIEPTGRDLDVAITGDGFFRLLKPDGGEVYSRLGAFGFDGGSSGSPPVLVDLATGYQVLNTQGATISTVNSIPASATTALQLSGNLPPTALQPLHGSRLSGLFSLTQRADGSPANGSTLLSATSIGTGSGAATTLNVFGTQPDGTAYSAAVALPANATIDDLVGALNQAFVLPAGGAFASATFDGSRLAVTSQATGSGLSVFLGEGAAPPAGSTDAVNNAWQHADAGVYSWNLTRLAPSESMIDTPLRIYTGDGSSHSLTARFVNTGTDAANGRIWDLVVAPPTTAEGSLVGSGVVQGYTFNANGTLAAAPSGSISSTWAAGGASTVALQPAAFTGFAGDGYADAEDDTGYPAGNLLSSAFDSAGRLVGTYSNGKTQAMSSADHQLGLARFANPGGLLAVGESQWAVGDNSGAPSYIAPGDGGVNAITSGALEASNVDLASEYTRLIIAQRSFQSNTKTFQVADEMSQMANGLVR